VGAARRPHLAPHTLRFAISDDAHSSVGRSLHILGLQPLVVPTDDHRLTLANLQETLRTDPHPETVIGIVATCGTTNAGIIDDLEDLGAYARAHDLWCHVDGAYGGAAMFAPAYHDQLRGLRHADSFIVDPHKWLFAPLDCAALLYRDPALARAVHTQQAGYLDVLHSGPDVETEWNPSDYAIHLSRRSRGLPFWFSLAVHGTAAYESAVQAGLDRAKATAARIAATPHLTLLREPDLSIVLFRREGWVDADYQDWSMRLLRDQIAFVTPTKWEGQTVARLSFLHPDTSDELVGQILDAMA
jgi:aromatic-L-amino-acid/L-tryptophan decarboxylase